MDNYTMVTIGNEFSLERAEKKVEKLLDTIGSTFYNFEIAACPIGGSFDIVVRSNYEFDTGDPEKEMLEVLMHIITSNL